MRAVHCVSARTKTRSKKSSSGMTRSSSRSAVLRCGAWSDGVVGMTRSSQGECRCTAYREFKPRPELSHLVACTWERRVEEDSFVRVLPDGSADIVSVDGSE